MIDFDHAPKLNLDDEALSGAVAVLDAPISSETDLTVDECMEIGSCDVLGYVAVGVAEDRDPLHPTEMQQEEDTQASGELEPMDWDEEAILISPEESRPPIQDGTQPRTTQNAERVAYLTKEQEEMVDANKNLPIFFARKYRGKSTPDEFEEICQVAMIALMHAVKRFDPEKGGFGAFASRIIVGRIKNYFRDSTWPVYVPHSDKKYYLAVDKAIRAGVDISDIDALSSATELSHEEVGIGLEARELRNIKSINTVNSDGDSTIQVPSPIDLSEDTVDKMVLRDALQNLDPILQEVLKLRLQGLSQEEIADKVGFSQMHVSRLIRKAFGELKKRGAYND